MNDRMTMDLLHFTAGARAVPFFVSYSFCAAFAVSWGESDLLFVWRKIAFLWNCKQFKLVENNRLNCFTLGRISHNLDSESIISCSERLKRRLGDLGQLFVQYSDFFLLRRCIFVSKVHIFCFEGLLFQIVHRMDFDFWTTVAAFYSLSISLKPFKPHDTWNSHGKLPVCVSIVSVCVFPSSKDVLLKKTLANEASL